MSSPAVYLEQKLSILSPQTPILFFFFGINIKNNRLQGQNAWFKIPATSFISCDMLGKLLSHSVSSFLTCKWE